MLRPPRIYVARHCKTTWNAQGLLQGKADVPLSEEGRSQARENVHRLGPLGIDRIVSSTKRRAIQTAAIYSRGLGVPYQRCADFDELDHGDWEGKRFDDLRSDPSSHFLQWLQNPGETPIPEGRETAESAQRRIVEGIRTIARAYPDEAVLVISHKHMIALLICALQRHSLSAFQQVIDESTEPYKLRECLVESLVSRANVGG